jgi:hypothetical protein
VQTGGRGGQRELVVIQTCLGLEGEEREEEEINEEAIHTHTYIHKIEHIKNESCRQRESEIIHK